MRFVADGAKIATLEVGELSGDTQDGSLNHRVLGDRS